MPSGNSFEALAGTLREIPRVLRADKPVLTKVDRAVRVARALILFRRARLGSLVSAGDVRVVADGKIEIGDHVNFFTGMFPSQLHCHDGGHLAIGDDTMFNYGVVIDCHESIRIGKSCMVASMVCVRDQNGRTRGPVVIEDHAWVAYGAIIEPGVRVGAGAVVAAGSVVTTDVPPDCLAAGNPARCLSLGLLLARPPK
jgi:maltose O-acetyltransferase